MSTCAFSGGAHRVSMVQRNKPEDAIMERKELERREIAEIMHRARQLRAEWIARKLRELVEKLERALHIGRGREARAGA